MMSLQELVRSFRVKGYVRVSSDDQNPQMQFDALTAAGLPISEILVDYESGMNPDRKAYRELIELIADLKIDYAAVYRIDRLGRDQYELVSFLRLLEDYDRGLVSVCEPFALHWRESSWAFRAMWETIGDARYELLRLKERQRQGIDAAKNAIRNGSRTKPMGRPRKIMAISSNI